MGVTGIGGVFFRARDPESLAQWYRTRLGLDSDAFGQWQQSAGSALIVPFPSDTEHLPADKQWMLNLRVDGIDALVAKLRDEGIDVLTDDAWDTPETGRFARITDPEGNAIELWQPPAD